jgi:hypothetical protein
MLRKDELAFIKANSLLDITTALLTELRKAMAMRQKMKFAVPAGTVVPGLELGRTPPNDRLHNSRVSARPTS